MFNSRCNKINLIKKSGKKYDDINYRDNGFKADSIILYDEISVVKGDILEIEENGKKIKYTVIHTSTDFITGKKIAEFKKVTITSTPKSSSSKALSSTKATTSGKMNNQIIVKGNNNKITISDSSISYTLTTQDKKDFEKLIEIANQINQNQTILKNIEEMKNSIGKESFRSKYDKFIKSIGKYMAIFSPYISFLPKFFE